MYKFFVTDNANNANINDTSEAPNDFAYAMIPIYKVNTEYTISVNTIYGKNVFSVALLDINKNIIKTYPGLYNYNDAIYEDSPAKLHYFDSGEYVTTDDFYNNSGLLTIQVPNNKAIKYIMVNLDNRYFDTEMCIEGSWEDFKRLYYTPYDMTEELEAENESILSNITIPKYENTNKIIPYTTKFLAKDNINLLKISEDTIQYDVFNYPPIQLSGINGRAAVAKVRIYEPGNYYYYVDRRTYGKNVVSFLVDKDGTLIQALFPVEEVTDDRTIFHVEINDTIYSDGCFLYINLQTLSQDKWMLCKDSFPDHFIPYQEEYYQADNLKVQASNVMGLNNDINTKLDNILYGKTIVFDGDSICHAALESSWNNISASDPDKHLGWAARIGQPNNMNWYNYAAGGATLVTGLYYGENNTPRHWVSSNIDTIYNAHPTLDYYIFEGGTNDADLLGLNEEKYGILNMGDYTNDNYDTTKFYNAMDMICYKATHYWPKAKIGYIVAPKMGTGYTDFTAQYSRRRFYFEMAIEVCKKWGIPYLDLWDSCPMNPKNPLHYNSSLTTDQNKQNGTSLYYDGQHPTIAGYDYLTPIIEHWIRTL